jgi:hypothetical protein
MFSESECKVSQELKTVNLQICLGKEDFGEESAEFGFVVGSGECDI